MRSELTCGVLFMLSTFVCACNAPPSVNDDGSTPDCGDGVQSSDELCDDNNLTPGDGCSAECIPSGARTDCVSLREGHWLDQVNAIVGMSDGSVVIGGVSTDVGPLGWVSRHTMQGDVSWIVNVDPGDGGFSEVKDLVADDQMGVWVLATQDAVDKLMHIDSAGALVETVDVPSAFATAETAFVLARFAGDLWLAGTSQGDLWLGRYETTTGEATTVLQDDHLGFSDEIHALMSDKNQLIVAATASSSPNFSGDLMLVAKTDIFLITIDEQGNETSRMNVLENPDDGFARRADSIIADSTGKIYVGGSHLSIDPTIADGTWVTALASDGGNLWSWSSSGITEERAGFRFGGIVVVEGALAMALGAYIDDSGGIRGEGWIARIADGTLAWYHATTDAEHQHYEYQQFLADSLGLPRVVGKAWTQDDKSSLEICNIAW